MKRHRTQVYLDPDQYRWLKRQAGADGSMASILRRLIDGEMERRKPTWEEDPLIRFLFLDPPFEGKPGSAETVDEEIYGPGAP